MDHISVSSLSLSIYVCAIVFLLWLYLACSFLFVFVGLCWPSHGPHLICRPPEFKESRRRVLRASPVCWKEMNKGARSTFFALRLALLHFRWCAGNGPCFEHSSKHQTPTCNTIKRKTCKHYGHHRLLLLLNAADFLIVVFLSQA